MASPPPEIFDRTRRRLVRDRAALAYRGFLHAHMAEDILDRLSLVQRRFADALVLGAGDGALVRALRTTGMTVAASDAGRRFAAACGGVQADEDLPPFADASFDLIVSVGVLDSVNDLPGALLLARRMLRPDGLLLAAFVGAGSFPVLRRAMLAADGVRVAAHIHPGVDVRTAGDLLGRAGFALPVADGARLTLRYAGLGALVDDLRGMAGSSLLEDIRPGGRAARARAEAAFLGHADPDGRVAETVEIVHLSGWAPAPSQPKPARPGSARASLADALRSPPPAPE